jgi:hypothetical protein
MTVITPSLVAVPLLFAAATLVSVSPPPQAESMAHAVKRLAMAV